MTTASTEDRTVAEVLVDLLARASVEHVFGVAGSTIMPILDALETDGRISYVGARYELSAAEMASGYARASARLGVVMTHVGPGATSVVTAMAGAARDGVPLLLITGNEESDTLPREPYHDWDLMGVMSSLTGFSYRISRVDDLPHVIRRALSEALRGVTRPVHIDLPEDLALARVGDDEAAGWLASVEPVLAAIAAAPAAPADGVDGGLAIIGDGSLFMSLSSLESVASLNAPVVVIVLDDGGFGSQRKKQQEGYGRNVGVDYNNPDIAAIAAAMQLEASWIESADDVERLCASFAGRKHGALAVVRRARHQEGTW